MCSNCRNAHIICSKVEAFIHVATQYLTMWLLYTELRVTAEQQTISDQLCCMSDHLSEIVKLLSHNLWTSVIAYCEHFVLVQQSLAFTNGTLHQSVFIATSDSVYLAHCSYIQCMATPRPAM